MAEKDFGSMSIEELKTYCDNLRIELDKAQWFLRNRIMKEVSKSQKITEKNPH